MSTHITSQLVEAMTQCRRKAFFLSQGTLDSDQHEYESINEQRASENRLRFLDQAMNGLPTTSTHWSRLELCPNGVVEATGLQADCQAVSQPKQDTQKRQRAFEPHLVVGTHTVTKEQKLRLAFAGFVIGEVRRYRPSSGWIVPMSSGPVRVSLDSQYPLVRKAVENIRRLTAEPNSAPTPLMLNSHCPLCPFRKHCRDEAEKTDNLTLLDRITPKLLKRYNDKGIFTVTQLSHVFRPRKRRKQRVQKAPFFNVELQALVVRTRKVYLEETPSLPASPIELYFDIEGIPDEGFHYLIGLVVKDDTQIVEHSFWADSKADERSIFEDCLDVAARYGDAPIYHYGSYELKAMLQVQKKHGLDVNRFADRLVNVNGSIFGKVYFPSRSNGLKDLGAVVGATWHSPDSSGLQSLVWRYRWEDTQDEDLKQMLLAYNRDDCNALRLLVTTLRDIGTAADTRGDVDFANDPKQLATSKGQDIHHALDRIVTSAHTKYKRGRIRISQRAAKPNASTGKRRGCPPKGIRAIDLHRVPAKGGKTVRIRRRRKCPHHKVPLTPSDQQSEHVLIDLAFTNAGCRKTVVRYTSTRGTCPVCHTSYLPATMSSLRNQVFGHSFKAWAVHQRVALRLPFDAIAREIEELFGENIHRQTVLTFVSQFAATYASTEESVLQRLLASPFVHVDETKLSIGGVDHYVWVITDSTHVVFRLTETREATVIKDLLDGYAGVLITDFYAGYDSVNCTQQKCLVHLIRDLNEDLRKNPFNAEFEEFVGNVRDLLVPIFEDVDKYGLRTRNLRKHMKRIERFRNTNIVGREFHCEITIKYQKRFARYIGEMFTFLELDGIPWNNNAAERALRHLVMQRRISGSFGKSGASSYLRLLGIEQTCRFQGKSFLRFLLSREGDIDKYREPKRRRASRRFDKTDEPVPDSDK
jgi:predicted RecB family nuclease